MGITLKLKINIANNTFFSFATSNGLGLRVDGA